MAESKASFALAPQSARKARTEVAQPGRRSDVDVERLQITLTKADIAQLDRVVRIGKLGRNRNEVAARIVSNWLYNESPAALGAYLAFLESGKNFDTRLPASGEEAV